MNIIGKILWSAFLLLAGAGLIYYGSIGIQRAAAMFEAKSSIGRFVYLAFATCFVVGFWYWIIWVMGRRLFISLWRDEE
jgi:hypothetical protein